MDQNNQFMNANETWPLYDTVCIGLGSTTYTQTWYETFAAVGNEASIPFFNQRSRSRVGEAYNNFDSAEQISYGFSCYSIGVEWYSPVLGETGTIIPEEQATAQLWMELARHSSLRLQVGQDEKLLINTLGAPAGAGISGTATNTNTNVPEINSAYYNGLGNGKAVLQNRWKFAEPIQIPRNRNLSASIEFSNYGKNLLQSMAGPGQFAIKNVSKRACIHMIRISMFGRREVQQRNQQHFR